MMHPRTKLVGFFAVLCLMLFSSCKISQQQATTELRRAVLNNEIPKVRKYVRKGALVNHKDPKRGWSPLLYAAQAGHLEVAAVLLKNGADPGQTSDKDEVFPLQRAASNGYLELVDLLVRNGADVDQQDGRHRATAMMFASLNGHTEVVRYLIDHGALLNVRSNRGESALFIAVSAQQYEVVKLLLDQGANKHRPNIYGTTCLQKAKE
ncbi:MAG: ankyrin repeat domain-containing protein [Bacteroidia bacterium]|nr:ankyrin repeat domain-containing protein [Bacteroidia bacterium]